MLCQNCQKRVANVHFTQVVNNHKVEMYLCEQCAKEKGQFSFDYPFNISDFFTGVMGFNGNTQYINSPHHNIACEKCGMTYEEFQKTGKLGCSNCYEIYGEKLKPLLKRLHGNVEHNGKIPERASRSIRESREIDRLKELLNQAVKNEEYEKAAEIRDKIKSLEAGKK